MPDDSARFFDVLPTLPVAGSLERLPRLAWTDVADVRIDAWVVVGDMSPTDVPTDVSTVVAQLDRQAASVDVDIGTLSDGRRVFRARVPRLADGRIAHRYAGQQVGRVLRRYRAMTVAIALAPTGNAECLALLEGVCTGGYVSPFKLADHDGGAHTLVVPGGSPPQASLRRAAERSAATAATRALVEAPANSLTPEAFARIAGAWSTRAGLDCLVIGPTDLAARGFVATDAIGRSSEHAPCAVVIRNRPGQGVDTAIVAKGVTFDAGGISLKAPSNMGKLKGDMAGAAAALCGAIAAAASGTDTSFALVLPLAENLPDGRALRPGDVLTFADGTRVHIESTDAEGRMLLADGLLHARQSFAPRRILSMGTLTKACIVALGNHFGALYATDEALARDLVAAGHSAGERLWRMPLAEEYAYSLRHPIADLANASNDGGGSIVAATFIRRFAGDLPWAHIDMSSFFFMDQELPWADKGYSGAGARLVHNLLCSPSDEATGGNP